MYWTRSSVSTPLPRSVILKYNEIALCGFGAVPRIPNALRKLHCQLTAEHLFGAGLVATDAITLGVIILNLAIFKTTTHEFAVISVRRSTVCDLCAWHLDPGDASIIS
jgi:hypothetical protein